MDNSNDRLIERIVYLMQADDSADAPADAVKWAKNIFRTRAAEPKRSLVQTVLAVLQMDLSPDRAAFGERSASAAQERQMLFSAGGNGIDLRVSGEENGFNLKGQILGEGFAGGVVKLEAAGKVFEATANDMSEFSVSGVTAGTYRLTLSAGDHEIVVEGLEIS